MITSQPTQQTNIVLNKEKKGKILFDIKDKEAYKATYPAQTGKGVHPALHELHVFLAPLNPEPETVDKALKVIEEYNAKYKDILDGYPMKMCFLTSIYDKNTPLDTLETGRYLRSDDNDKVIEEIYKDAEFFMDYGFDVLRIKIEASAYTNKGIPQTDEEASTLYPEKYFEHHFKIEHKTLKAPLPAKEEQALDKFMAKIAAQYKVPFVVSWNNNQHKNSQDYHTPPQKRFLNIRFRNKGLKTVIQNVADIKRAVNESTNFKVLKVIDEYGWYDTNMEIDQGWIDPAPK
jgi:hypothetical protein